MKFKIGDIVIFNGDLCRVYSAESVDNYGLERVVDGVSWDMCDEEDITEVKQ